MHTHPSSMVKKKNESTSNAETIKKSLIKARAVIKKKFQELHNHRTTFDRQINEEYKPIIDPLKIIAKKAKEEENELRKPKGEIKQDPEEPASIYKTANRRSHKKKNVRFNKPYRSNIPTMRGISPLPTDESDSDDLSFHSVPNSLEESLGEQVSAKTPQNSNYGFYMSDNRLQLGKDEVKVIDNRYFVKGKSFAITNGLTDLLLRENPQQYSKADLKAYKSMLTLTSAHKTDCKKNGAIRRNPNSAKYNDVIKKLFPIRQSPRLRRTKSGGCIKKPQTDFKVVNRAKEMNYTYWDDPNELVNRLRLLHASQSAGHTGHDNEIISIIEELREAKIIK